MDDHLSRHLELLLEFKLDKLIDDLDHRIPAIDGEFAGQGQFWSHSRLERIFGLIREAVLDFPDQAVAISLEKGGFGREALSVISDLAQSHFNYWTDCTPSITRLRSGSAPESVREAMHAHAEELMNKIHKDLDKRLKIAAFNLDALPPLSGSQDDNDKKAEKDTKRAVSPVDLSGWWQGLDAQTQNLPQTTLLELARSAFPNKFISRERVRELTPGRKRGPRPFGGKVTAELPPK